GTSDPAGECAEFWLGELPRLAQRLVAGGQDEVLEHLHVVLGHDLGIDLDGDDLLLAIGFDGYHAAAGGRLDLALADLFLQRRHLLLQLLRFLHHVAEALHWLSPSGRRGRTATHSARTSRPAVSTGGASAAPPPPSSLPSMLHSRA